MLIKVINYVLNIHFNTLIVICVLKLALTWKKFLIICPVCPDQNMYLNNCSRD